MENPQDFANAFRVFYGDEVGNEIAKLFTEHISIASDIAKALKLGNASDVEKINMAWRKNAEDIAEFLSEINNNWHAEDWSAMLNEHLDLLRESMENTLAQDYLANTRNFDEMDVQALSMADIMAEGIYMQFPY